MGIAVSGDYAYVASYASDAMVVIDISTPSNPTRVGEITGVVNYLDYARGIAVSGDYAYVTSYTSDAMVVIDISWSEPQNLYTDLP